MSWLTDIKLSLTHWLLATLAVICGGLVIALRLQGSRLHKAQIDAISARIDLANNKEEAIIDSLKEDLEKHVSAYNNSKPNSSY